jgi:molybdate transport system substrate-binding protein
MRGRGPDAGSARDSTRGMATRLAPAIALLAILAGCGVPTTRPAPSPITLTVFAAASLAGPLATIATTYEAETGVHVLLATDASSALRTQIEQGAQADVFLAADTKNPASLAAEGLTVGPAIPFAGNHLAIVVPADNPGGVRTPFDLGRNGIRIIAAGEAVPITAYAVKLLDLLAALPGAPADLPSGYSSNVVSREDNVRAVLAKIELGEGDAAIVYATDATGIAKVRTIPIPEPAQVTATYAGVVPSTARAPEAALAFLAWLAGPRGAAALGAFGFLAAPSPAAS